MLKARRTRRSIIAGMTMPDEGKEVLLAATRRQGPGCHRAPSDLVLARSGVDLHMSGVPCDVIPDLAKRLGDLSLESGPNADALRVQSEIEALKDALNEVTKERDLLRRKYNLMVVAWALEKGASVQLLRRMDDNERLFCASLDNMVKNGRPV